jgi:hypothetical protein
MQALKERFEYILNSYKEFQSEWEDLILEKINYLEKYKGTRADLIEIERNSERMRVVLTLLKMGINELNEKGVKPKSSESTKVIDEYVKIAKVIIECNSYYSNKNPSKNSIALQTRLSTNYQEYGELSIYRELLDKKKDDNKTVVDYSKVNFALTCYLESNIRHIFLDRLFIKWLADKEIISYIVDVNIRKLDWTPRGRIEQEEERVFRLKDGVNGYINLKILASLIIFGILTIVGSLLTSFIPNWSGFVISLFMIISWFYVRNKNKKDSIKALGNLEKITPIKTMIKKMSYFYFDIRAESPLPISIIKNKLNDLENAGAEMPSGILAIIEDLEERNIKWL